MIFLAWPKAFIAIGWSASFRETKRFMIAPTAEEIETNITLIEEHGMMGLCKVRNISLLNVSKTCRHQVQKLTTRSGIPVWNVTAIADLRMMEGQPMPVFSSIHVFHSSYMSAQSFPLARSSFLILPGNKPMRPKMC
jgi:hypothetical protein